MITYDERGNVIIRPQAGRQEAFMATPADIAVYGGSAGGGKTWSLIAEPLRHVDNGGFGAVFFRRTYPEITGERGPWDESMELYPFFGSDAKVGRLEHNFPSGARVSFRHLQREEDKYSYQGAQIALILFDQVERISQSTFFYMLSRNRSMCGVTPYVRASCNPDADSWLADFLSWWIADDGYADLSREGLIRWFIRASDEQIVWADTPQELTAKYPGSLPKSVTFIPASVYDNAILLANNPEYLANLMALPLVDRLRLLGDERRGGNWKIREEAGKVFNRDWFEIVQAIPAGGVEVRFWDLAATKKKLKGEDPDFTASIKMRKVHGVFYISDCTNDLHGPTEADRAMRNRAAQDHRAATESDTRYMVRWEREPGASGKRDTVRISQMLARFDAKGIPPQGDKITRAKPLAAQAEAGNVKLLAAPWNEMLLDHLHNQPEIAKDDMMDAGSGAYNVLSRVGTVRRFA